MVNERCPNQTEIGEREKYVCVCIKKITNVISMRLKNKPVCLRSVMKPKQKSSVTLTVTEIIRIILKSKLLPIEIRSRREQERGVVAIVEFTPQLGFEPRT